MFNVFDSEKGRGSSKHYFVARVKRVVLGPNITDNQTDSLYKSEKDIGAIQYELLYSGKTGVSGNKKNTKPAYPMFPHVKQYPNIGEIVLIFPGPSADLNDSAQSQDLWYMSPYNIFNHPHHNVFPNMAEYEAFIKNQLPNNANGANDFSTYSVPQGNTFIERGNIKLLRPFEGDTIIQGRWGQSVRFGSTVPQLKSINTWSKNGSSGDPITIIVNSQKKYTKQEEESPTTVEDINRDGSAIYLTSNQSISIVDINLYQIRSYSFSKASDPQTQTVIFPESVPTSNEYNSPQAQDINSQNNNTNANASTSTTQVSPDEYHGKENSYTEPNGSITVQKWDGYIHSFILKTDWQSKYGNG